MDVYLLKFFYKYICACGCGQSFDNPAEALVKADTAVEAWAKLEAQMEARSWVAIDQLNETILRHEQDVLVLE